MSPMDTNSKQSLSNNFAHEVGNGIGKNNGYQLAIEAIQETCKQYKVKFDIKISGGKSGYVSKYQCQWRITVLSKTFTSSDFVIASAEAIRFIINAFKP